MSTGVQIGLNKPVELTNRGDRGGGRGESTADVAIARTGGAAGGLRKGEGSCRDRGSRFEVRSPASALLVDFDH